MMAVPLMFSDRRVVILLAMKLCLAEWALPESCRCSPIKRSEVVKAARGLHCCGSLSVEKKRGGGAQSCASVPSTTCWPETSKAVGEVMAVMGPLRVLG